MESKIISAKSPDEAVKQLLNSTNADEKTIKVTIKKSPSKGFLGLGSKDGVYELSYELVEEVVLDKVENNDVEIDSENKDIKLDTLQKDSCEELSTNEDSKVDVEYEMEVARNFITQLLKNADVNADIEVLLDGDLIKINIKGEEASCLIGRRGETLDSIQFLVGLALNKVNKNSNTRVFVNIEDYRSKREESLKRYCYKAAREVARTKKTKKLDYMNPYERRIIHSALQNDRYVITYSEGTDPYRRVVIEYKK